MPYRITHSGKPAEEIRRIALEQVQKGLREIDDTELSVAEKIHQVRKRCKKVRGLVRLIREENPELYGLENHWFRDTARPLSGLRDAKAMQDSYDAVMETFDDQLNRLAFASIRRRLTGERKQLQEAEDDAAARLATARDRLATAEQRIQGWQLKMNGFETLGGYVRTYKRARKALRQSAAEATPEAYHEWRKRVKYHWYHTRILETVRPAMTEPRGQQLSQLSDWLGLDHDLAVLGDTIGESPEDFGETRDLQVFLAALQARRRELERESQQLGRLLFAEKPKAHGKRIAQYWAAWRHGG